MRCKRNRPKGLILDNSWVVDFRSIVKEEKPLQAEMGNHKQVRLNLSQSFKKAYEDGLAAWEADGWIYKTKDLTKFGPRTIIVKEFFNKINRRKKQMFNDYEMKYLIENNDRDLVAMDSAIQTLINNLAKNGKELAILQEKRAVMFSIKQTLDEENKESESEDNDE